MSKAFLFYESYLEAVENFPEEYQLEMLKAIIKYALSGEEPQAPGFAAGALAFVKPTIDKNSKLRAAAEKGGQANKERIEALGSTNESHTEAIGSQKAISHSEAKDEPSYKIKDKEIKDKGQENLDEGIKDIGDTPHNPPSRGREVFTPPTVDEVADYIWEKGYHFSAEAFVSYYASQKWKKANGRPLSDWKQACVTWEARRKEEKPRSGTNRVADELNGFYEMADEWAAERGA